MASAYLRAEGQNRHWPRLTECAEVIERLEEQYQAALAVIDFAWEAMEEVCEAMSEPVDEAAGVADSASGAVLAKIAEFRASYPASSPQDDPFGYIEIDERGNCPHGIHKGLGCRVCDPAMRPVE